MKSWKGRHILETNKLFVLQRALSYFFVFTKITQRDIFEYDSFVTVFEDLLLQWLDITQIPTIHNSLCNGASAILKF